MGQFVWFVAGIGCGYLLWDATHRDTVHESLKFDVPAAGQICNCASENMVVRKDDFYASSESGIAPSVLTETSLSKLEDSPAVESRGKHALGEQEYTDALELSPHGISNLLIELGIQPQIAERLKLRIGEDRMALLEMRNRATREGWLHESEYQMQLQRLSATSNKIRAEFGDAVFDRYLYATKRTNRVDVVDVYPGSAAEAIGLQSGDRILRYGLTPIYSINGLVELTASGYDGEATLVEFRRGNQPMSITVPRGPLGVLLSAQRVRPGGGQE